MFKRPPGVSAARTFRSAATGFAKNIVPIRENAYSNVCSNFVSSTSRVAKVTFVTPDS